MALNVNCGAAVAVAFRGDVVDKRQNEKKITVEESHRRAYISTPPRHPLAVFEIQRCIGVFFLPEMKAAVCAAFSRQEDDYSSASITRTLSPTYGCHASSSERDPSLHMSSMVL